MRNDCRYNMTTKGAPHAVASCTSLGENLRLTFRHSGNSVMVDLTPEVAQELLRQLTFRLTACDYTRAKSLERLGQKARQ